MDSKFATIVLMILVHARCAIGAKPATDLLLYRDLLTNYTSALRPIEGENFLKQIVIYAQMGLTQIESLIEVDQQLASQGFINLFWKDELLTWKPADYGYASFIIVPASDVWLPEITPVNSVIGGTELASLGANTRVRITHRGQVTWSPAFKMKTTCDIDVTYLPYDQQECEIHFANWMYTAHLVNFSAIQEVMMKAYQSNQEWAIIKAITWTEQMEDEHFTYPFLKTRITMKRNPRFFELNILLPSIMLSFLMIPIYLLPVEAGEKITLGITLTLANSIFLLMLNDVTPRSGTTPKITTLILIASVFSALSILTTVMIINIHHHTPNKPVPKWVKSLILVKLAGLLCCMKYTDENRVQPFTNSDFDNQNMVNEKREGKDFSNMGDITKTLNYFKQKNLAQEQLDEIRDTWNKIARVLDRMFFIIYLLLFTLNVFGIIMLKLSTA